MNRNMSGRIIFFVMVCACSASNSALGSSPTASIKKEEKKPTMNRRDKSPFQYFLAREKARLDETDPTAPGYAQNMKELTLLEGLVGSIVEFGEDLA